MKDFFLANWKGKITSLFLAVAIWYLIDANLRRPDRIQIPVPGTSQPQLDTSPNSVVPIPGGGSPDTSNTKSAPTRIEERVERELFGFQGIECDGVANFRTVVFTLPS